MNMANTSSYKDRNAPRIHEISISEDFHGGDIDGGAGGRGCDGGIGFTRYSVHIPATPDNQPMEISAGSSSFNENTYMSTCMFPDGSSYVIPVADDDDSGGGGGGGGRGGPCGCGFDRDEGCLGSKDHENGRRLSLIKSNNALAEGQSESPDGFSAQFLIEPKKNYGYGNAVWPLDEDPEVVFPDKDWKLKPLTTRLDISAAIIAPYRILIFVRMIVLGLFLYWRVTNPNEAAIWLWGISVVCEFWFSFSWLLDKLPKLCPVNRVANLDVLTEKFETCTSNNQAGKKPVLSGIDIFVSTGDSVREPPLVTANSILSILAADYPVEQVSCYVSDDGGSLLTFEAMAEAASFANLWVPFCRKHQIEPRNPESYFNLKKDPYKNKLRQDFVRDRRRVKREYDEFKVRINALSDVIRRRSDTYNIQMEVKAMKNWKENDEDEPIEQSKVIKATWMADGTHWPGAWSVPAPWHAMADHANIIQVMLQPPCDEQLKGTVNECNSIDFSEVDIRLPMLVYVSRERRPGYDHNNKAGAINALIRASAVMSNGPFILNLDSDHYIYNSQALKEGMCFMMDRGGDGICYVQFPLRFERDDPSDQHADLNTAFFDVNMRALDGIQGPMCVGTGCLFRRTALYGFDPPISKKIATISSVLGKHQIDKEIHCALIPKKFGNSSEFINSVKEAAFNCSDTERHCISRKPLHSSSIAEAVNIISCWYEDKTEWGQHVGWIYGAVTEEVVTGYRTHRRGWKSNYCTSNKDAFRGTAPLNLTDRLHQDLRSMTGSVEMFFSRNNPLLGGHRLKLLQRIAYLNIAIHPFASIFITVYCFLPALSLFTNQFIVESLNINFLIYLLMITLTNCILGMLEMKWSGISVQDLWKNQQFWIIEGTSANLAAVIHGILKVVSGIEIRTNLTSKSPRNDSEEESGHQNMIKWTVLMIPPCTIIMVNMIAMAVGICRSIYGKTTESKWIKLVGGMVFSIWVLAHLYPFAKGILGRRGKTPTIVFVWSGLISISISLLWVAIDPPSGQNQIGGLIQFP